VEPKPVGVIIGARLSALHTARGLSRGQLGSALGTTGNQIADYDSGQMRILSAHLIEMCAFFPGEFGGLVPEV
jgi:hypothetical protein